MAKSETRKPAYFLNRIALDKMINSESADPYNVIREVFSYSAVRLWPYVDSPND
jgi:hypothetical protein